MAYNPPRDPTAVFGRRVLAVLIDAALVLIPTFVLITADFEYLSTDGLEVNGEPATGQEYCDALLEQQDGFCADASDIDDRVYFADEVSPGPTFLFWGANLALLVVLQGLTGWTPGKLVTGIRTVREDGRPPGLAKALVRWLLWIVDGFFYVLPLVGFIVGLTTVGHRRVGDMVAKTFVVRASAAGSPIVVPGLTAPPPLDPTGGGWGSPPPGDPSTAGWGAPPPLPSGAPQWDEARGTYIQWDPAQQRWMQWNEGQRTWSAIPGQ